MHVFLKVRIIPLIVKREAPRLIRIGSKLLLTFMMTVSK